MPLVLRYVGASKAVPALGKQKDSRRERKLRHRAGKGISAQIKAFILLFRGKEKKQLSAPVTSWAKDFHALTLCCVEAHLFVRAGFIWERGRKKHLFSRLNLGMHLLGGPDSDSQ